MRENMRPWLSLLALPLRLSGSPWCVHSEPRFPPYVSERAGSPMCGCLPDYCHPRPAASLSPSSSPGLDSLQSTLI